MVWIVKFCPLDGAIMHDLTFRTEARAREVYRSATDAPDGGLIPRHYRDDFNIELCIDPTKCAILMADMASLIAQQHAADIARKSAMQKIGVAQAAGQGHMPQGFHTG